MHPHRLIAPAAVLAGAAALLLPAETRPFDVYGDTLDLTQRDFRILNAFSGAWANTNLTPDPDFPGSVGAELAIRKGVAEWGSRPHGSGTTDRTQAVLGSGGSNFDAFFAGRALAPGGPNANVISAIPGGGGAWAFTDLPIGDGWRIRFLDAARDWSDHPLGPTGGASPMDIQGVATHEFGHALGLDHSAVPGATMSTSTSNLGLDFRSLHADDIAGVQFLYGPIGPRKPRIDGYSLPLPGLVRLSGERFHATDNEVWFTPHDPLVPGDGTPVRVTGLASSAGGTVLDLVIPAGAGPGSVAVRLPGDGDQALSNVHPFDPVREPWTPPVAYGAAGLSGAGTPVELDWATLPSVTAGTFQLRVTGADPTASFAVLVSGTMQDTRTTPYGTLLVGGPLRREAVLSLFLGLGSVEVDVPTSALVGSTRTYQVWASDGGASGGVFSGGLLVEFTP